MYPWNIYWYVICYNQVLSQLLHILIVCCTFSFFIHILHQSITGDKGFNMCEYFCFFIAIKRMAYNTLYYIPNLVIQRKPSIFDVSNATEKGFSLKN